MKTLELNNNDRFNHWDALVAQANAAFKKESAIVYESLRELARNQRVVSTRLSSTENTDDGMFCDTIETSKVQLAEKTDDVSAVRALIKHDEFAVILKAQTDESGAAAPLGYGNIRFTRLKDNDTTERKSNLAFGDDAATVDKQVIDSLTSVLRGSDQLAFMYTPYVMAITRLLSVDLEAVQLDPRPDTQVWSMQAIAGEYLVTTQFDFGKVCDYFNL